METESDPKAERLDVGVELTHGDPWVVAAESVKGEDQNRAGEGDASKIGELAPGRSHWDAFWAGHAHGKGLFNWLLWITRFVFSSVHAWILVRRCHKTKSVMNPSVRILEVGCGSATTTGFIDRLLDRSQGYAIDLSEEAIKVARQCNPLLQCVVADAMDLPFADGKFALAFSSGVLEHFERSTAQALFDEHCRVVVEGGTVAMTVPWRASPYNLLRILCGRHWPFGHENPFLRKELHRFLNGHALDCIEVRTTFATTLTAMGTKPHNRRRLVNSLSTDLGDGSGEDEELRMGSSPILERREESHER